MVLRGVTERDTALAFGPVVEPADTLGELIKRELRRRGLTQTSWAEDLGVHQGTVSKWCSDRRSQFPAPEFLPVIAEFLHLDLDEVRALRHNLEPISFAAMEERMDGLEGTVAEVRRAQTQLGRTLDEIASRLNRLLDARQDPPAETPDPVSTDGAV